MKKNLVYFDLETQKSASEVGGWQNKRDMRMSIGVTYSTANEAYRIYAEDEATLLIDELRKADCVIGFNIIGFDFPVLEAYSVFDLGGVVALDLMTDIEKGLGRRLGLDALTTETLGVGKTGHGMEALKWWKEGKVKEIAEYCCYDVKATKLLHEYGVAQGRVHYVNDRTQRRETIPVSWGR
ncbi:MAG: ribonuclease H-like domain-containing protein [Verrucomicrobium sp.]|nr:ribonuclease H-like domain-containing protein [Verrucomicrobium sp.]